MNCGTEMNARLPSVSVGRIEYMVYAFISMASSVLLMLDVGCTVSSMRSVSVCEAGGAASAPLAPRHLHISLFISLLQLNQYFATFTFHLGMALWLRSFAKLIYFNHNHMGGARPARCGHRDHVHVLFCFCLVISLSCVGIELSRAARRPGRRPAPAPPPTPHRIRLASYSDIIIVL